jgi:regulation of enolase protein 1 (concanavalin A-like superfamily)
VSTSGPAIVAPVWLRLVRSGNEISGYYKVTEGAAWTLVGTQTFASLDSAMQAGLAVSSHTRSGLAAARFDRLQIIQRQPLPDGWSSDDVGTVGAAGRAQLSDVAAVTGSGADVWGTADEFHWVHRRASGDFTFDARVDRVDNVDRWTKAGLMIRSSGSPSSQYAFVLATPTSQKGIAFQGRTTNGGAAVQVAQTTAVPAVVAPVDLRITRMGNTIAAYARRVSEDDGWHLLGTLTMTALPADVDVGLAVTSHDDGVLATAQFSRIVLEPMAP